MPNVKMPNVKNHESFVEEALRRPGVRKEYDALEEEFALLKEMVKAQEDIAKEK